MSIWSDWASGTFGPLRAPRTKRSGRAQARRGRRRARANWTIARLSGSAWGFERLEDRRVLSVTSSFLAGTLSINLTANDTVALSAVGGNVQLSINGIGGFNPDSGVLQAANVNAIVVTATGNFANTIDLTSVNKSDYSALLTVSLNAGAGDDLYKIDQSILPVAAVVNVSDSGLTGTDTLQLISSGAGPETIGISDSSVSRSSGPAVGYSGLEQLTVNGTNGGDTINVSKTNSTTATIVNAGSGLDLFGNIDLTQIGAAGLTIHAGGNGEALTLNTTTTGTVSVSGTQVQRSGNGAVTYDGLASLAVNGTSGADTFNVTGTASGTATTIDGKDGGDVYNVTHTGLAGALSVSDTGTTGSDQLTDSSTAAGPETIAISDTQVTRSGGSAALTYSGLEQLTVNGTNGGDTINVTGTASGTTTTIDGKAGGDIYNVTQSGMAGPLFVSDSISGGTNQLTSSTSAGGPEIIGITNSQVTRSGAAAITYIGIQVLIVNGSALDDAISVVSTISGTTTVNAGSGNDTITVGNANHKLDDIQGNLTINGNDNVAPPAGGDTLIFDDSGQTTGQKYTLIDNKLTRGSSPAINFGTIETLELNSGSANDKFVVNFSSYPKNPAMKVKFNFGEALHATPDDLQINGTSGNDTILVSTTNSTLGEQFLLNDIDCLQMFGNAGNDVLVNDTNVSSLIDGGTGSDVLVGGSNTDVIFGGSQLAGQHDKDILYGRGGNDFLFADYDYNAGQPKVLHQTKNGDQVFGDDAPSAAVSALYGLPSFAPGAPGIDTIVIIGADSVSAGGQVGDTIIGSGFQQLTVVDWLRARFLKPTSKNIQDAINQAKQVDCFKTTF
jgi:hypothetical protein